MPKFKNLINWFFRINLALAAAVVITSIFFWVYFTSSLFFAPFGVAIAAFLMLLPLFIPKTEGLNLPKRIELSAIIGGAIVAFAGAVFLIGEYQDQKQARIIRAWDLLHKATQLSYERINTAELKLDAVIAAKKKEIEALD